MSGEVTDVSGQVHLGEKISQGLTVAAGPLVAGLLFWGCSVHAFFNALADIGSLVSFSLTWPLIAADAI